MTTRQSVTVKQSQLQKFICPRWFFQIRSSNCLFSFANLIHQRNAAWHSLRSSALWSGLSQKNFQSQQSGTIGFDFELENDLQLCHCRGVADSRSQAEQIRLNRSNRNDWRAQTVTRGTWFACSFFFVLSEFNLPLLGLLWHSAVLKSNSSLISIRTLRTL